MLVAEEPRRIARWGRRRDGGPPEDYLRGKWEERNWLNVPGPFYGAMTDTCVAGFPQAPGNVLYDESGREFVWRQPQTLTEMRNVLNAASADPFDGYGWDGDDHWTADAVLAWAERRDEVQAWIERAQSAAIFIGAADNQAREAGLASLRAYSDYLNGPLDRDLELYATWLASRSLS